MSFWSRWPVVKIHHPHIVHSGGKVKVVDDDGHVYGTHPNESAAEDQVGALYYAKDKELKKSGPTSSPQTDDEGARHSRQTSEFVNALENDPNKPGYKKNPIPTYEGTVGPVDRTKYAMGNVRVNDLKTRQQYIEGDRIKSFQHDFKPTRDTDHPLVVVTRDNQLVVDNGNHRVAHMIAHGVKTTPARIVHEIHGYGGQGKGSVP